MSVEESEELGSLDAISCIRCNGDIGGRKLLVCSEIGCPIAIHEECMCSQPVVDQLGKFYCPYCAYKREFVRTRELRRKAMRSKTSLSKFIDAGGDGKGCGCDGGRVDGQVLDRCVGGEGGEHTRRNETEERDNGGDNVGCGGEGVTEGIGAQPCASEEHEFENREDGERVDEEAQQEVEIVEETPPEDVEPGNDCYVEEKGNKDHVHDGLDQEDKDEEYIRESEDEEQMEPEGNEVPADRTVVSESDEPDTGSPLVRKKSFKRKAQKKARPQNVASSRTVPSPSRESSSRQTSDVDEDPKDQNEKAKTSSKKKRERKLVLTDGKRRRLEWTDEELDILKEGVRIYASEDKKTPWKKILDYGHTVFHKTRLPVDLKDKWRTFTKKVKRR